MTKKKNKNDPKNRTLNKLKEQIFYNISPATQLVETIFQALQKEEHMFYYSSE